MKISIELLELIVIFLTVFVVIIGSGIGFFSLLGQLLQ
jgi:hypothetical protein